MKTLFISTLFLISINYTSAQRVAHATIYSEGHEKFTVYLNNEKKNDEPKENVRIINLTQLYFKLHIEFEDQALAPIDRKLFQVQNAQGNPVDATFKITKNKKGEMGIHWVSQTDFPSYIETNKPTVIVVPGTVVQQTTTQTQVSEPNGVRMSFGVPGGSVNINTGTSNPTSEKTTTTTIVGNSNATNLPCANVLGEADFNDALKSINARSSEESKVLSAKQIIASNCFTTAMVKKVLQIFPSEDKKLEIAKFSYAHTIDQGNYFKLNSEFKNESSIDELNKVIVK